RKVSTVKRFQPVVAGVLILLSFAVQYVAGGAWDTVLGPQWWVAAGEHAHVAGHNLTLANALMLLAAVVAGSSIVVNAVASLASSVISIDLLLSVPALGAIIIGNFWEAAAVTFLFVIGRGLEAATMNKPRSALTALIAVAPDVAVL